LFVLEGDDKHESFACPVTGQAADQLIMNSASLRKFYLSLRSVLFKMSRRPHSPEPLSKSVKKQKLDNLTSEDYKNGVFLAPMVRSGACKQKSTPLLIITQTVDSAY
jgi:hypothetical protein